MKKTNAASIRARLKNHADTSKQVGKQTQWNAFLRKNKLDAISFIDVVTELRLAFHRLGVIT